MTDSNNNSGNVIYIDFGLGSGRASVTNARDNEREPRAANVREESKAAKPSVAPPPADARQSDPTLALFSTTDAARVVGVSPTRLRYWARTGFLTPSGRSGKQVRYTFQDLIGLRAARGLLGQGVPLARVRKATTALKEALPRVTAPLAELRVVADGGTLVAHSAEGAFDAQSGQLRLSFEVSELRDDVVRVLARDVGTRPVAAYEHYLEGCRLDEDETTLELAQAAYERAVELDPSLASAMTNLGNVKFRRGLLQDAERCYRRALAIDGAQPEALYNLGFLAHERGDGRGASELFERALSIDPTFADAQFNFAVVLEELGRPTEARTHWRAYLELEPAGAWSDIARRHVLSSERPQDRAQGVEPAHPSID